jgi:hypothetical protein
MSETCLNCQSKQADIERLEGIIKSVADVIAYTPPEVRWQHPIWHLVLSIAARVRREVEK